MALPAKTLVSNKQGVFPACVSQELEKVPVLGLLRGPRPALSQVKYELLVRQPHYITSPWVHGSGWLREGLGGLITVKGCF